MREKDYALMFRETLEHALNEHFPKRKCKERSGALMLFAVALVQHELIMAEVRMHLGVLLDRHSISEKEYEGALSFYQKLTGNKDS